VVLLAGFGRFDMSLRCRMSLLVGRDDGRSCTACSAGEKV
jgi:hypothetical protein